MKVFVITAAVIAVVGIIVCLAGIWHEFRPLWTKPAYTARHRGTGRVSWPAEVRSQLRRQADRARRTAYLAMMVIPAQPVPEPDEWLPAIRTGAHRRLDELDFRPAVDHRYDSLAPRVLDAQAHLARKGLRLRTPAPVVEPGDVWELVGAA